MTEPIQKKVGEMTDAEFESYSQMTAAAREQAEAKLLKQEEANWGKRFDPEKQEEAFREAATKVIEGQGR